MLAIPSCEFEAYEAIIKSGQMPDDEVPKFLEENQEFKAWYSGRSPLVRDDLELQAPQTFPTP